MTRSVRVAIDLRLAGYRSGGIARYGHELTNALQRIAGVETVPIRSAQDSTHDAHAVRFRTPPHHRLERVSIPVELRLRRVRADVYHAIDFISPLFPGMPCVATVHDLSFIHWPQDLAPAGLGYYQQLSRTARHTAAWITPSAWTADDLSEVYDIPRTSIHVVPHGVPQALISPPPLSYAERKPFLLAVGTIEPRKQYSLMLDAHRLGRDLPPLIVIGQSGWNSQDIEQRLRSEPGVEWRQNVGDAELRALYRDALAVLIPSRGEGFGFTALEAMAAGTPVVSSGGGALPEVTADAALTVSDATPEAWAAAMECIVTDATRWSTLSHAGRVRAADFTWERAAQQTRDVYRAVSLESRYTART